MYRGSLKAFKSPQDGYEIVRTTQSHTHILHHSTQIIALFITILHHLRQLSATQNGKSTVLFEGGFTPWCMVLRGR